MTSAGAKIAVLFEPDAELTSRLNNEKEFRFVEVPTEEGKQDAEEPEPGTTEPGGEGPNGGETPGGVIGWIGWRFQPLPKKRIIPNRTPEG